MADKIISVPGIGNVSFPGSMSDDAISQVVKKQYDTYIENKTPPSMDQYGGMPKVEPPPKPTGLTKPEDQPYNFVNPPAGIIRTGLNQAKEGTTALLSGRKAAGGADIIEGLGRASLPAAIPFAATAPAATVAATGLGLGAQELAKVIAEKLGLSPDEARLSGDVASLIPYAGMTSPRVKNAMEQGLKGGIKEAFSPTPRTGGRLSRLFGGIPGIATMGAAEMGKYGGKTLGGMFGMPQEGETLGTVLGAGYPAARGMYEGAVKGWKAPVNEPKIKYEPNTGAKVETPEKPEATKKQEVVVQQVDKQKEGDKKEEKDKENKENEKGVSDREINRPIVNYTSKLQDHEIDALQSTDRAAKENRLAQYLFTSKHDLEARPTADMLKTLGKDAGLTYEPSLRTYENAVTKARILKKVEGTSNAPQSSDR